MRITLKEYAKKHGKNPATARQRAIRGAFKTAKKEGRDWFIDGDEPWLDHRLKEEKKEKKKGGKNEEKY